MKFGSSEAIFSVVFIRHGQSVWNKENRFIGWTDSNLTKTGEIEARVAGQLLSQSKFNFDVVFTSLLKRSIKTSWVILDELGLQHLPVVADWRLNERCYGALVGQNKKEIVKKFGPEQVKIWRRSFDVPPPPISDTSPLWPGNVSKYDFLPKHLIPKTESLKDTMKRSVDVWENTIKPVIQSGKHVLVCGHENNLRSLLKHIDKISDDDIKNVELPRAVPLLYHFDKEMQPIKLPNATKYLNGAFIGDMEEIEAIRIRDEKNVYDVSSDVNLELLGENEHFAAKLDDLIPPCSVVYDNRSNGENDELNCRETEITDTPPLLYDGIDVKNYK